MSGSSLVTPVGLCHSLLSSPARPVMEGTGKKGLASGAKRDLVLASHPPCPRPDLLGRRELALQGSGPDGLLDSWGKSRGQVLPDTTPSSCRTFLSGFKVHSLTWGPGLAIVCLSGENSGEMTSSLGHTPMASTRGVAPRAVGSPRTIKVTVSRTGEHHTPSEDCSLTPPPLGNPSATATG